MFGNQERRRKEKRIRYFFSFVWIVRIATRKKMKRKYMFFFLLSYPYKCKRYIKIMNKYVTLYHIILCARVLLFKNHSSPSVTAKLSRLQICEFKRNGFFFLITFMVSIQRKRLRIFSFIFSSSFLPPFKTDCKFL